MTTTITSGAIYKLGDVYLLIFPDGSVTIQLGDGDVVELDPPAISDLADLGTLLSAPEVQATIGQFLDRQHGITPLRPIEGATQ